MLRPGSYTQVINEGLFNPITGERGPPFVMNIEVTELSFIKGKVVGLPPLDVQRAAMTLTRELGGIGIPPPRPTQRVQTGQQLQQPLQPAAVSAPMSEAPGAGKAPPPSHKQMATLQVVPVPVQADPVVKILPAPTGVPSSVTGNPFMGVGTQSVGQSVDVYLTAFGTGEDEMALFGEGMGTPLLPSLGSPMNTPSPDMRDILDPASVGPGARIGSTQGNLPADTGEPSNQDEPPMEVGEAADQQIGSPATLPTPNVAPGSSTPRTSS